MSRKSVSDMKKQSVRRSTIICNSSQIPKVLFSLPTDECERKNGVNPLLKPACVEFRVGIPEIHLHRRQMDTENLIFASVGC